MLGVVVAVSFVGAPPPAPVRPRRGEGEFRQATWQGIDDPSDFLVLLRFQSEDAAQDDLRQLVESGDAPSADVNLPSEVHHIAIQRQQGTVLDEVPADGTLAIAETMAGPGYGEQARERLQDVLATFVQVEGYCGHIMGFNEAMEEETWSFVFGSRQFKVPLPDNPEVAVRLYRRLS